MTWVTAANQALLTDLYELTMAASYYGRDMRERASFDLFVRTLPPQRNFLVVCGIEQALDYLESMHFDERAISYLRSLDLFDEEFLTYLEGFRFSGDVHAMAEGEVVFKSEPLLEVSAPFIEAQIVETFLLNCVIHQTMIASKAARIALACGDRRFVDFSPRRDHGADAALKGARAAYVGGASGTSNVLAGEAYGIPVSGTMAHSYVMAFEDELSAFRAFADDFPDRAVLLIDTFDVEEGARRAAQVGRELASRGRRLHGVRIDSGDVAHLSRSVRKILDEAGCKQAEIVLSGDLDEYRIAELLADGVPVDSFGVGTQLGTSGDAPALGGVYKLVADESGPKMKLSSDKVTLPGRKQTYRFLRGGRIDHDLIALEEESGAGGRPLLSPVMSGGVRTGPQESLQTIKDRAAGSLETLPDPLRSLTRSHEVHVATSLSLGELVARIRARHY